jgi:hypothetical protein
MGSQRQYPLHVLAGELTGGAWTWFIHKPIQTPVQRGTPVESR